MNKMLCVNEFSEKTLGLLLWLLLLLVLRRKGETINGIVCSTLEEPVKKKTARFYCCVITV